MFLDKFLKEAAETVAENAAEAANTVASMAADASEKAAEAISTGTEIASNLGEQAINAASAGINTVVEEGGKVLGAAVNAAQQLHHDQLLAYYNPVFPEQYQSSDYDSAVLMPTVCMNTRYKSIPLHQWRFLLHELPK